MTRRDIWNVTKAFLFVLLVPGLLAGYLPYYLAAEVWQSRIDLGVLRSLAWVFWTSGAAALVHCAWLFGTMAHSTPYQGDTPSNLIVTGLYAYVRNPMYVAQLLLIIGHVLWSGAPMLLLYLLEYGIGVFLIATLYEEPALTRLFGDRYQKYRQNVPAWFPRLQAYTPVKE